MSRRRAAFLSWTMWVLGLAGMAIGAVLAARNPPISTNEPPSSLLEDIIWVSSFVGFGLVGALLVSSRPSNRIGWILSGITFGMGIQVFASQYGRYALVTEPGTLPLGRLAAWVTAWGALVPVTLVVFLVLLYPTGSITTTLGRFVAKVFLFMAALDLAAFALRPGPVEGDTPPRNPLGISGADRFLDPTVAILGAVLALLFVVVLIDLFVRFRRSRGVERQQFRWFLTAVGVLPILFILANLLEQGITGERGFDPTVVIFPLWGIGTAAAIAVAITRHGLYEIDRIVSRTLSYSLVVGFLALVFFAVVTGLTSVLPGESDLAVAGSTLAVAALFNPVRRRVQSGVDRRFNRSHFDAERVMEEFAGSLRDQVDPDEVVEGWVGVVSETMQPKTVAVWVKE
ncbi:MAG TPA: hypothetical protein VM848_01955 [Acidimicrobiia bacterium]|nr:hypothetical protein [Acidimicrobiia bacterium]